MNVDDKKEVIKRSTKRLEQLTQKQLNCQQGSFINDFIFLLELETIDKHGWVEEKAQIFKY